MIDSNENFSCNGQEGNEAVCVSTNDTPGSVAEHSVKALYDCQVAIGIACGNKADVIYAYKNGEELLSDAGQGIKELLVQLAVDKDLEEAKKLKGFLQKLGIRTTLQEMHIPLDREYLQAMLTETVTGPDMEHIPYPVTEEMIFEAMKVVENL